MHTPNIHKERKGEQETSEKKRNTKYSVQKKIDPILIKKYISKTNSFPFFAFVQPKEAYK